MPAEIWQPLIERSKAADPECRFFAETLGCTPAQVLGLRGAGFDYLFNSAKWWDFRAPWLLEQYDLYRQVAPTVAFPENHDTERLAIELGDPEPAELERHYRLRYLFAATFSTGVLMPMGYEYGCRTRMDVVASRPGDWEWETAQPRLDLTGFIGAVNAMRAACPALNVEGAQKKITAPHSPVSRPAPPLGRRPAVVRGRGDRPDQPRPRPRLGRRSGPAARPGRRPDQRVRGRDAGGGAGRLRAGPADHARAPAAARVPQPGRGAAPAAATIREGGRPGQRAAPARRSPPTGS